MTDIANLSETLTESSRSDIPVDHLDFAYIEKCQNIKELQKIYRVLKSGKEGKYLELETFCENKLKSLHPESRVLRKETRLLSPGEIDPDEWKEIDSELKEWISSSKLAQSRDRQQPAAVGKKLLNSGFDEDNLPPIRSTQIINGGQAKTAQSSCLKTKRVMPRDYNEWSKIEKELEEDSDDDSSTKKSEPKEKPSEKKSVSFGGASKPDLETSINTSRMSPQERIVFAEREKEKGNEAFRAGDLEEALAYYSRSIAAHPIPACYNNRALINIKLKRWIEAVKDSSKVLKVEPDNMKALMRRATAYNEQHRLTEASADLTRLLKQDPDHKPAKTLLEKVSCEQKKRDESKLSGGRRMVIEEEDSSDEEEEADPEQETPQPSAATHSETVEFPNCDQSGTSSGKDKEDNNLQPSSGTCNSTEQTMSSSPLVTETDIWSSDEVPVISKQIDDSSRSNRSSNMVHSHGDNTTAKISTETDRRSCWQEHQAETLDQKYNRLKEEGNGFFKNKDYDSAIRLYDQCIDLSPDHVTAYRNRALCNIQLDKPNDAIYDCNMALDIDDKCHVSLYRRGLARKLLGDYSTALQDLLNALTMKPDSAAIRKEVDTVKSLLCGSSSEQNKRLIYEVEESKPETKSPSESRTPSASRTAAWDNSETGDTIRDSELLPHERKERTQNKTVTSNLPDCDIVDNKTTGDSELLSNGIVGQSDVSTNQMTNNSSHPTEEETSDESNCASRQQLSEATKMKAEDAAESPILTTPLPKVLQFISPNEFRNRYIALRPKFPSDKVGDLLRHVDHTRLPKYISNQLDDVMLSAILTSLKNYFLPHNLLKDCFDLLLNLCLVERFPIVSAMMPPSCQKDVRAVISRLELEMKNGSLCNLSDNDIAKLKSAYRL